MKIEQLQILYSKALKQIKQNELQKTTHFVYPFLQRAANWKEIIFSIRSIEKYYQGKFHIFIIGDLPPAINANKITFIPSSCIANKDGSQPIDIVKKLNKVIADKRINENFVWMNDDIYFMNPVFYEDIAILKAIENLDLIRKSVKTPYRDNLWNTYNVLKSNNCPVWNYGTHLPFVYNKKNMKLLIEKFNLAKNPLLISSLYHNYFFQKAIPLLLNLPTDNIKVAVYRKDPDINMLKKFLKTKKFFNHSQTGFSDAIKNILLVSFPDKSSFEI